MLRLYQLCALLFSSLFLGACSGVWDNTVGLVMGPNEVRTSEPPPPQQLPNVKQIIIANAGKIFDRSSNPKNIMISIGVRHIDVVGGTAQYGACVRANLTNVTGKDMGTVTYVVAVSKDQISDRRKAIPSDGCGKEKYEPLK